MARRALLDRLVCRLLGHRPRTYLGHAYGRLLFESVVCSRCGASLRKVFYEGTT